MPLHISMMHCAVRVIGSIRDPKRKTGERRGPIGTGFFITVASETHADLRYGYVVTADHVIWDQNQIEVQAPDPTQNGALHPPIDIDGWRKPLADVDLAIAPFNYGNTDYRLYQALQLERQVLPLGDIPDLWARIHYIGILVPLHRPMARSGTICALEQRGIEHDGGYDYPAHLVDCRSYGGFSGSPCFVETAFASLTPIPPQPLIEGAMGPVGLLQYRAVLCGMFTEHLSDRSGDIPASRYGVGVMVRSDEIREALMNDDSRKELQEWDAYEAAKQDDTPKLIGASPVVAGEYEHFESLARKLVNTPKKEIDEKRKGES